MRCGVPAAFQANANWLPTKPQIPVMNMVMLPFEVAA
jgi:hypothetical protein